MYRSQNTLLCDDNGTYLSDLKINLTVETAKYRVELVKHELCSDLHYQYGGRRFRDYHAEDSVYRLANEAHQKMTDILARIRNIERSITALQPDFRSPITSINFPRVGR
jgi:hypothetical protein